MLKDELMKKIALCTLILLVSLPSCKKDKTEQPERKKPKTEQRVNMFTSDDRDEYTNEDYLEDEDDLSTLFDDTGDVDFEGGDLDDADYQPEEDEEYPEDENMDMAWIDASMDDELKPLYFEFNKYTLHDSQKQALSHDIEQVKQLIADAGDSKALVVAEGHTCQEGTPEYNIGLSENRAQSIANLLVDAGIARDNIKIVGRGQENPVVEGKTRTERAPNRRVELRVIYT